MQLKMREKKRGKKRGEGGMDEEVMVKCVYERERERESTHTHMKPSD